MSIIFFHIFIDFFGALCYNAIGRKNQKRNVVMEIEKNGKIPAIVTIKTERCGVRTSLFDNLINAILGEDESEDGQLSPETELMMGIMPAADAKDGFFVKGESPCEMEKLEIISEGYLEDDGDVYAVSYVESELTGLDGSLSVISFRHGDRELVTMMRSGAVSTAMTFKPHHRTISSYQTPFMPFQLGIHCLGVSNDLPGGGLLCLNYIIEIRGAKAEWCHMQIDFKEIDGSITS